MILSIPRNHTHYDDDRHNAQDHVTPELTEEYKIVRAYAFPTIRYHPYIIICFIIIFIITIVIISIVLDITIMILINIKITIINITSSSKLQLSL